MIWLIKRNFCFISSIQYIWIALLTGCFLVGGPLIQEGQAVMPPHLTGSEPEEGGILDGSTITFQGFSLNYADLKELKITDLDTGKAVPFSTDLACKLVGEGLKEKDPPPGSVQRSCTLDVNLSQVIAGHHYRVQFLDLDMKVRAAGP
jgi:hypothetical protein